MTIFTHVNVDLDAVASVWAARNFKGMKDAKVEFRPAQWGGEEMTTDDMAVDIVADEKGIKGEKETNGTIHSCFVSIMKCALENVRYALRNLITFINFQDSRGSAIESLLSSVTVQKWQMETIVTASLQSVFNALKFGNSDQFVVEHMSEIFDGYLKVGLARLDAKKEVKRAEILPGGKVAIIKTENEFLPTAELFRKGAKAVVCQDGFSLGVIRERNETIRMDDPSVIAVVESAGEAVEWFAHSAGFLYCRGSRKSPATTPSRVDIRKLAEAVAGLFG